MAKEKINFKAPLKLNVVEAKKIMPVDMADLGLNPGEYRFVAAYCTNGFVSWKAYYSAGYQAKTKNMCLSRSAQVLSRDRVQSAVRRFIDIIIQPYKEKLEYMVMEAYYRRAFYDVSMFYDEDARLLPLDEIKQKNPEWLIVIDGVTNKGRSAKEHEKIVEYKLADRNEALRQIQQIVTMTKDAGNGMDDLPSDRRKKLREIFAQKIVEDGAVIPFRDKTG